MPCLTIAAPLTFGIMCEPQTNVATMFLSESPLPQKERLPHSKWGIFSFVLALFSIFSFILFIPFVIISAGLMSGGLLTPSIRHFIGNLWMGGSLFSAMAAVIFGIIGICQPRTPKGFSICGILLPVPLLLFYIFSLIVVGVVGIRV